MTKYDNLVEELKKRKYNSSFTESKRSIINLRSFLIKGRSLSKISESIFEKSVSQYRILSETPLSEELNNFNFIRKQKKYEFPIHGKLSDIKLSAMKITFTISIASKKKLISQSFEFKQKKKNIKFHFLEYILNETPFDGFAGRLAKFAYMKNLKKRLKFLTHLLKKEDIVVKRRFSIIQQLYKMRETR